MLFTDSFIHPTNKVTQVFSESDLLYLSPLWTNQLRCPDCVYFEMSQRGSLHTRCLNIHSPMGCICSQFTGPCKMMNTTGGSHSIIGLEVAHCHLPWSPWRHSGKVTESCRRIAMMLGWFEVQTEFAGTRIRAAGAIPNVIYPMMLQIILFGLAAGGCTHYIPTDGWDPCWGEEWKKKIGVGYTSVYFLFYHLMDIVFSLVFANSESKFRGKKRRCKDCGKYVGLKWNV